MALRRINQNVPGHLYDRLAETTLREDRTISMKTPARTRAPGPLHAQDGHQQQSPAQPHGRPGHIPLEGLRPRRQARDHDARGG